jgi:hypothetical protein
MQFKFYGMITILFLSTNLLVSFPSDAVGKNQVGEYIIAENNQQNISVKFQSLKSAVKSFNEDLKTIAQTRRNGDNFNADNLLNQLESLRQEVSLLSQNSQLSSSPNNVNAIITEIERIIKPLNKGLTKNAVTQVQKDLGFFPRRKIDERFYGTFGLTTQEELEKFTTQKIQELEPEINTLESLSNSDKFTSNNAITSPSNNNTNADKNNNLIEINAVKSSLYNLTLTVMILGFMIAGLLLFCVYRIINIVEQQRKLTRLVNSNQNFIDTENFQIQMDEIFRTLNNLDMRLKQVENSQQNQPQNQPQNQSQNYSYTSNINPVTPTPQPTERVVKTNPVTSKHKPENLAHLSNSNMQLVSVYNMNARSLSEQATTVSESEYTAEQRRLGGNVQPVLECDSRGNYWVIGEGNIEYLVPKAKMKINEHNYLTVSTFFNCSGYNPNLSNNFTLIKPAKLSSIGDKWELIETGELQF